MAGLVPAIFARLAVAQMAGTRPAMTVAWLAMTVAWLAMTVAWPAMMVAWDCTTARFARHDG